MTKNIKTKYDRKKTFIVFELIADTGFSESFIRRSISGEKKSDAAMAIKKEFEKRYNK